MLPLSIQLKNYLGWQSRGKLQMVLKEKSVLKGRGINTKGVILSPSKSFSIFFLHKNISFGLNVFRQITFSFFAMIYSLPFLPLTALRPSNTSNIFLQLVAYKVSLQGEIQFIACFTFYLFGKFLCCKRQKILLLFADQVESTTQNKLYFTLQRNLVRDQLLENIARITLALL